MNINEHYEEKLAEIEHIHRMWRGAFISSGYAMCEISKIIDTEFKMVNNVMITDKNGETLFLGGATLGIHRN